MFYMEYSHTVTIKYAEPLLSKKAGLSQELSNHAGHVLQLRLKQKQSQRQQTHRVPHREEDFS